MHNSGLKSSALKMPALTSTHTYLLNSDELGSVICFKPCSVVSWQYPYHALLQRRLAVWPLTWLPGVIGSVGGLPRVCRAISLDLTSGRNPVPFWLVTWRLSSILSTYPRHASCTNIWEERPEFYGRCVKLLYMENKWHSIWCLTCCFEAFLAVIQEKYIMYESICKVRNADVSYKILHFLYEYRIQLFNGKSLPSCSPFKQ